MRFLNNIYSFQTLNGIFDKIKNYYISQGILKFVLESLFVLAILVFLLYFLYKYTHKKWLTISILFFVGLYAVIVILDFKYMLRLYGYIALIYLIAWTLYFIPNIRNVFEGLTKPKNVKKFVNNEEQQEILIENLMRAVAHLSERQIGAIMTIEREDSLNTYIAKGTTLNSEVTSELLETIFLPGTPLHDGAVIIREDRIMSAGSFYPTSETTKISKNLGSRHRAALGISEVSDAFTIVVSEETGNVSITAEGSLTLVTLEGLRSFLKENILVK